MKEFSDRFEIWQNEGAFFDEPWLHDKETDKDYRYDRVPPRIRRAFAADIKERCHVSEAEIHMLLSFALYYGRRKKKEVIDLAVKKTGKKVKTTKKH